MKRVIYILSIALISAASACKKEATTQNMGSHKIPLSVDHLAGTWKIAGRMISAGGPPSFVPATGNDYVNFKADGTMSGSAFPDFVSYTLRTDSSTVTIRKADINTYENYHTTISNDTLTMDPSGPVLCIEGCAIKLVKQ